MLYIFVIYDLRCYLVFVIAIYHVYTLYIIGKSDALSGCFFIFFCHYRFWNILKWRKIWNNFKVKVWPKGKINHVRKPSSSEGVTVCSVAKANQKYGCVCNKCNFEPRVSERELEINMCTHGAFMNLKISCIKGRG